LRGIKIINIRYVNNILYKHNWDNECIKELWDARAGEMELYRGHDILKAAFM